MTNLFRSPDPDGHYARLRVSPSAPAEAIVAAWRREARRLHPDVPGTGDAAAFLALKRAYDVLNHPRTRAAYDGAAPADRPAPAGREPEEIGPMPVPDIAAAPARHPRLTDLPAAVWAVMAAVLLAGSIEVALRLSAPPPPPRHDAIPANARGVPPLSPPETPAPAASQTAPTPYIPPPPTPGGSAAGAAHGPAPVRLAGTPNFYVAPAASAAMLWRADEARQALVPWSQLPAFSAVQAIRLSKQTGLVEVKVTDSLNGFVEAGRLTPGDADAARRAWCTFHAGPPPANGEILSRAAEGQATLTLRNRSGQPVVAKLRGADGSVAVSMFLSPGGEAAMTGLPGQPARLDFATGEVWSRACRGFTAGMRARSMVEPVAVGTLAALGVPPDRDAAAREIPDQVFERQ